MNAKLLFTSIFDKMEIRTAATPPMVIELRGPSNPVTSALLNRFKPAVIFTGPNDMRYEVAPYGLPAGIDPTLVKAGKMGGAGLLLGAIGAFILVRYL